MLTVTTAADSGPGSLRQALLDANASPGLDTINFSIASGAQTIALASALPAVSDSAVIDGTTQPGWAGLPLVTLDGGGAGTADGLDLVADDCAVRGLTVTKFTGSGVLALSSADALQGDFLVGNGLDGATVAGNGARLGGNLISGNGRCGVFLSEADGCVIAGNRVGTNFAGADALPNAAGGVAAFGPIPSLTISQNLISGNTGSGVTLFRTGASLSGNFIGANAAGTAAVPNGGYGVALLDTGGDSVGGPGVAGNLISGNALSGAVLDRALGNVQLAGNKIGTDAAGAAALPNGGDGVTLLNSGGGVTVGGGAAGEGNVLSGNGGSGVFLFNSPGAVIQGNRIGADASGAAALGNAGDGVTLSVGTSAVAIRDNVLSGNVRAGALIGGGPDDGNVVQGNMIGTDASGTAALGNGVAGVVVYDGADGNTIGGTAAGDGNLIAGNGGPGVILADVSRANLVQGNTIGGALGNDGDGVRVSDSDSNTVGGTVAAASNVISGNQGFGVALVGEGSAGNLIQGNRVGTLADGTPLGNASDGVYVADQAHDNTVGGTAAGAANVIAFNGNDGVLVGLDSDFDTVPAGAGNAVEANSIHDNSSLGIDLSGGGENLFGVTANDLGQPPDADTGPNNLQNYPVITEVAPGANGGTDVTFTLDSTPNTPFRVEFFANDAPNGSGFGEGQTYLGFVTAVTDASGHFAQTMNVAGTVADGQTVTATATDPAGNTSEFSADFPRAT